MLNKIEPPVPAETIDLSLPFPTLPPDSSSIEMAEPENQTSGSSGGAVQTSSVAASGNIAASWTSSAISRFFASSVGASGATVENSLGATIGSGAVALSTVATTMLSISGNTQYSVNGQGSLSFYGPAESSLGLSGDWQKYAAMVTGSVSITLTVPAGVLRLNGEALPAGTYTITTNSATLSGSGATSSPNFAGSASIAATGGTINLGPGSGNLSAGGTPLDPEDETTLDGYNGTISVSANGDGTLSVGLNGNAGNVLQVISPTAFTTDQNTPITFQSSVQTSLADTYNLTANAPTGWTVTIDDNGNVTATPAPGLQGGTYPIQIIAQSQTDPNLEAQCTVEVTIAPAQPGVNFNVVPDPLFTVPYNGAQLPTAFRATIQNLGPAADTYNLTFSNIPNGFTLEESATSDTVPAGQTGIVGLYLVPDPGQPVPPEGTQLSFTVTATSTTDPSITQTQTETFTVPEIDAVNVPSTPTTLNTIPGVPVTDTITITNFGNVEEDNIDLTATLPSGLTISGLTPIASLAAGQSASETVTLTPDSSTPLNTTLDATITVTFGQSASPLTETFVLPVNLVVPGATALANAAEAAASIGNSALSEQLNDLSIALTSLVENPTNAVYLSESLAAITSIVSQVSNDPFLASFAAPFTAASTALANAMSLSDINTALTNLGTAIGPLATTLTDEGAHGFSLSLLPSEGVALPQAATTYQVDIQSNGTAATTYDLSVTGMPAGVSGSFNQSSVTLQPGQLISGGANGVTLSLTETGDSLVPASFTVTATADGAPEITLGAPGQLTPRNESILVAGVSTNPPFTNAGGQVDVSAQIQTAVNEPTQIQVSYTATDSNGNLLFTSSPVTVALTILSSLTTVDLGDLDTTGFAEGIDTISVTVADASGNPIPGATGQGTLTVGSPVTATIAVTPTTLPTGTGTVTNTLEVDHEEPMPSPLSLEGVVTTTAPETSVALYGNYAYESGQGGVNIIDVSDPTDPQLVGTFAQNLVVNGSLGFNVDKIVNGELIIATQNTLNTSYFNLLVYSLADPLNPQLVSNTKVDYQFVSDLLVNSTGTAAFIPLSGVDSFFGFIDGQSGDFLSLDLSNLSQPQLADVLYNNVGPPEGSNHNEHGGVLVNDNLAYVASTTSTGGDLQSGTGQLLIVNTSDPADLSEVGSLDIPGTVQLTDVAISGNEALVVGNTGGWIDTFPPPGLSGNVTLTLLNITNPESPTIIGSTVVTPETFDGSVVALPNGEFLVSGTQLNSKPVLLLVDPSDPNSLAVGATIVPSAVDGMTVSGNTLYATTAQGLSVYNVGPMAETPVTVSVEVPNNTGVSIVPNSFNVPPTQTIVGTNYDTLVWTQTMAALDSSFTYTWQTTVSDLGSGETRDLTLGTSVAFTDQGTPGSLSLPATSVTGEPIIEVIPASQTTQPGGATTYDVRLMNPTNAQVTYFVYEDDNNYGTFSSVEFEPYENSGIDVTVGPEGTVDVPLVITTYPDGSLGDNPFTVTAESDYQPGALGTAQGDLTLAGTPIPVVQSDLNAYGAVATLTPSQATAGQETSANFIVQLTNTGSTEEQLDGSVSGLPDGVYAYFPEAYSVNLQPGASNFVDQALTLEDYGATPGSYPFTVTYTGYTDQDTPFTATAEGTLTVVANGVYVDLIPASGSPGTTFDMLVYNAGTVQDTFALSLGGPAALVSSLATDQVTLSPGTHQYVPITTSSVNFAAQGTLELTATATSEGNPNVQDSARAELDIAPTQGMTAQFQEPTQVIPIPGTADFLLLVNNTGNTQDSYSATITGTTGPVTASLTGLDGNPTQSIPEFILPGLSTGAIILQTDLTAAGQGTVTVDVQSLSNPNETATATATVSAAATSTPFQPVIQLTSSPGSTTTYGQPVSFTATVGPPASGDPTPTGSVQFQIDGSNFGSPVTLDDNGSATSEAISTLTADGHTITALYSGDPTYAQGSQTLTQTVNPATPTVNVSAPNGTYDAAPYNALTSSVIGVNSANLGDASSFTYYVGMGIGGTDLGSAAPTAAGTYTVVAYYAGSADYTAADSVPTSFTIAQQAITVTANAQTKVYGSTDPALTYQLTSGSLAGTDALTGGLTRSPGENVGSYAIGEGTLSAGPNYNLTFVAADLTITPATLVVTAGNLDINHGDSIPTPGYAVTGFVRDDTQAVLSGAPNFSTPANANNAAGVYSITVTQGTLAATNYVFQFVAGSLTVHPKVTDVDVQWGKQTMSIMNLHRDLPFTDITAIDIIFSDNVTVSKSDLTLTGVSIPLYSLKGFQYNPATYEATWTLPTALGIDQLMIALDGTSPSGVHTATSDIALQSNLGLGFSVLPGDVDGDGVVTVLDAVDVLNEIAANQQYSVWDDVVGDGVVDMNDYLAVRTRIGTKLPKP